MSNNNNWQVLAKQIHDELNVIKRDALVPYAISHDNDEEYETQNVRDLYEKLLIDVEMGSCGKGDDVTMMIIKTMIVMVLARG